MAKLPVGVCEARFRYRPSTCPALWDPVLGRDMLQCRIRQFALSFPLPVLQGNPPSLQNTACALAAYSSRSSDCLQNPEIMCPAAAHESCASRTALRGNLGCAGGRQRAAFFNCGSWGSLRNLCHSKFGTLANWVGFAGKNFHTWKINVLSIF